MLKIWFFEFLNGQVRFAPATHVFKKLEQRETKIENLRLNLLSNDITVFEQNPSF